MVVMVVMVTVIIVMVVFFTCCGLLARQISSNLISSCELQTLPEKKRKVIKKDREGEAFSLHEK